MTPEAALLLALSVTPRGAPAPERREPLPAQVYYGAELPAPFLPVLPAAAPWELPDDLRDAVGSAAPGAPATGWAAAPASLLLRGPGGALLHELGLGPFEEEGLRRRMAGAASADGRFAWYWQRAERPELSRVERSRAESVLVLLGSRGQILLRLDGADAPPGLPPAAASADGETLLAARRENAGWTVAAYSFTGKELAAVARAHRVEAMALTPDGRRALVVWAGLDQPLMATVLDLRAGERLDLPAAELPPGPWSLAPDGTLLARGRPVTPRP